MSGPAPPLDWLNEGVARVDAAGGVVAVNAAMAAWFAAGEQLTAAVDSEALAALEAGRAADVRRGESWLRLRLFAVDGQRWLLARDVSAEHRAAATERGSLRLRGLASIAGGVVHELANRTAAVLGRAEQVGDHLPAAAAGELDGLVTAANEMLQLLGSLSRLLAWRPAAAEVVALDGLAGEATVLVRKFGQRRSRPLVLEPGEDPAPRFRGVRVDALAAVTAALLYAMRSGDGPLRVRVGRASAARRRCAELRIADVGDLGPYRSLAAALRAEDPDVVWRGLTAAGSAEFELLQAVFGLRCHGGSMRAECAPGTDGARGARELVVLWPEVGP